MRAVIVKCEGSNLTQKPSDMRTRNHNVKPELVVEYKCPECGRVMEKAGYDPQKPPTRVVVKLHARKEIQT